MPRKTVRKRPAAPLVQEQPGNLIRLSTETRENIKLEKTLESLPTSCTIQIVCTPNADPETVEIKAEDIHHRTLDNAKLGQGQFGIVEKLTVRSSNGNSKIIACKRIPIQSGLHNFYQNKSCLQDKEVAKKSKNCRYTGWYPRNHADVEMGGQFWAFSGFKQGWGRLRYRHLT